VPTDRTLQSAEAFAYHAGFAASNPQLYQPETLRRIQAGASISAEDARQQREELKDMRAQIACVFEEVDVLVTPTTPVVAPTIAELQQNPDRLRPRELALLRNTRPFNIWGLPAISVPCGFTSTGLPIGIQISGLHWREDQVLQMACAFEEATEWHERQPPGM
jgi:aspartyl-tRNA(Asn)/glutamyl-tRNA(Gln) amidotransferase subunit A